MLFNFQQFYQFGVILNSVGQFGLILECPGRKLRLLWGVAGRVIWPRIFCQNISVCIYIERPDALARSSWPDRAGPIELARSTWHHRPGRIVLARSSWSDQPGSLVLARSAWPHRPGSLVLARSSWADRSWPDRTGPIDLAASPQPND